MLRLMRLTVFRSKSNKRALRQLQLMRKLLKLSVMQSSKSKRLKLLSNPSMPLFAHKLMLTVMSKNSAHRLNCLRDRRKQKLRSTSNSKRLRLREFKQRLFALQQNKKLKVSELPV